MCHGRSTLNKEEPFTNMNIKEDDNMNNKVDNNMRNM